MNCMYDTGCDCLRQRYSIPVCCLCFLYLIVHHTRAVLAVRQLVRCSASRHEQQQVGCVCDFQLIGLVSSTDDRALVLIPSNHQAADREECSLELTICL